MRRTFFRLMRPSSWSIRTKIMLTLTVVGLITTLAATSLLRTSLESDLRDRLLENAESIAHGVALSCETIHATHDIKRMVFAVAAEPDVEQVLVIDVDQEKVIAADRSTWADRPLHEVLDRELRLQLREAIAEDGDRFQFNQGSNDIVGITTCRLRMAESSPTMGAVVLKMSGKRITSTTEAWINRLIRSLVVIFLALLVAVAAAVEVLVLRPIRILKQASLTRWRPVDEPADAPGDELKAFGETLVKAETGIVQAVRDLQRLRWAVDQSAVVIVTDRHGNIESANDQFQRFCNWDLLQVRGQLLPLASRSDLEDIIEYARRGDSWRGELGFLTHHSELAWLDTTVIPRFEVDGQVRELNWLGFDVTARRQAESEATRLRVSTERIIETALDGVVTIDLSGRITEWNSQAAEIFGYSRSEAIGRSLAELIIPPELHNAHRMGLERYLYTGETRVLGRRIEVEAVRKDGSRFPAELTVNAILTSPDRGFAAFVRDITDRKANERELVAARDEARAASLAKTEFLANVSHELRTPLTSILGYAEILASTIETDTLTVDHRMAADTIHRNGLHLLGLINDILDLSKIEAGKLTVMRSQFDLREALEETVQSLLYRATEKGLTLDLQVAPDVPRLFYTDPLRLRQILNNLLGNAVKFTEQGSISIHAQVAPATEPNGSAMLLIEVQDTGIGMTSEQLARLFTPFEQVDSSAGRRFGGTGLGLAISLRCAHMLGGDLAVSSRWGEGSRFRLKLPFESPPSPSLVTSTTTNSSASMIESPRAIHRPTTLPPRAPRETTGAIFPGLVNEQELTLSGCRILLVEDGADNRRLITFLLQKMGASVQVAQDGLEALERMGISPQGDDQTDPSVSYDLVISDMQMPRMDGYALVSHLRSLGCHLPIVALTAHGMDGDRERCLAVGCDGFAVKPIDRSALFEACLAALSTRSPR